MEGTILSKYGGSSITSSEDVQRIAQITEDEPGRKYIVVSAPGSRQEGDIKVTQLLVRLASARSQEAESLIEEIASRYNFYPHSEETIVNELRARQSRQDLSAETYLDNLKAWGEEINARYLAKELGAEYIDPKDFLLVERATVLFEESYRKIKGLKEKLKGGRYVFPGFYGYTPTGEIATLSFGGSDLTGAVLARGLEVEVYENFTDCPICAASPRIVDNPAPIEELTYKELRDLSYSGFNIFHQEAMIPLEDTSILTHVRSTKRYPEKGTRVMQDRISDLNRPVVGIAYKDGFCSYTIEKSGLNEEIGVLCGILDIFRQRKISIEFPAVGIDDISIVLAQEQLAKDNLVSQIRNEIYQAMGRAAIRFRDNLGCLVVAGKGLQRNAKISREIEIALAENNLEVRSISRGMERRCLIYGLDMEDGPRAVRVLYDKFIKS